MRFFKNAFAAVAIVALGVVGAFAQSENVVVTGIQSVTTASSTLQVSVSELTLTNFPAKGPVIVSGLKNLTVSITTFTQSITFTKPVPFGNAAAEEIVQVLTGFVKVHQLLLSTIIGKQSLASRFFLTAPIAAALRAIEKAVDSFAFTLIALIPTQADNARIQFTALSASFSEAITTYSVVDADGPSVIIENDSVLATHVVSALALRLRFKMKTAKS
ncbi:hypothetical protein GSI_07386 [Ganoderma sinense ZZ0214-1]|uniref:FAS1 domain-containing protein n=1 Tax=Ganoderma sinense ZZ0214-1 TaxID=1077348 RepID=A0A2G8SA97_9APHY|nr:hypothetical protein GSI_07386 [Ganoderma sinense ZZ0214-1]